MHTKFPRIGPPSLYLPAGHTRTLSRAHSGPHPRSYTHQPIGRSNLEGCDIVIEGIDEIDAKYPPHGEACMRRLNNYTRSHACALRVYCVCSPCFDCRGMGLSLFFSCIKVLTFVQCDWLQAKCIGSSRGIGEVKTRRYVGWTWGKGMGVAALLPDGRWHYDC